MLSWIDVEGTAYSGLLSEWIDGVVPQEPSALVFDPLQDLLDRLHHDARLEGRLRAHGHPVGTCAEHYLATLHDRFIEDLRSIVASHRHSSSPARSSCEHRC